MQIIKMCEKIIYNPIDSLAKNMQIYANLFTTCRDLNIVGYAKI